MTSGTSDQAILENAAHRMSQSVEFLKRDLNTVRTGRATPGLVDNLMVEYYGTLTPLNHLASISAPEAQLILIQPWDRQSIQDIERSIMKSPLNLNPSNDGSVIRLPIQRPPVKRSQGAPQGHGGLLLAAVEGGEGDDGTEGLLPVDQHFRRDIV